MLNLPVIKIMNISENKVLFNDSELTGHVFTNSVYPWSITHCILSIWSGTTPIYVARDIIISVNQACGLLHEFSTNYKFYELVFCLWLQNIISNQKITRFYLAFLLTSEKWFSFNLSYITALMSPFISGKIKTFYSRFIINIEDCICFKRSGFDKKLQGIAKLL